MKIEWTQSAELDLYELYAWIARDSPVNAEAFIDDLLEAVSLLREQPLMGRTVPEAGRDDVRELLFENYRIPYQASATCLYILGVLHGSRDLEGMPKKPWE